MQLGFYYGLLYRLAALSAVISLEISHQDLEDPNGKLCNASRWCDEEEGGEEGIGFVAASKLNERNCMCDGNCDKYGDCCLNKPHFSVSQQRRASSAHKCVHLPSEQYQHVYMKTDCPPSWRHTNIRQQCEKSVSQRADDPWLMTPVTSSATNVTYGNLFCAICNKDNHTVTSWKVNVDCNISEDKRPFNYDYNYIENNLSFNGFSKNWQVDVNGTQYKCDLLFKMPDALSARIRPCVPAIKTCPATWEKAEIRQRCESYTLMVHKNSIPRNSFRNVHCAICNSVPVHLLSCEKEGDDMPEKVHVRLLQSFSVLFDFNIGGIRNSILSPCSGNQVYDKFRAECREIFSAPNDQHHQQEQQQLPIEQRINCSAVVLGQTEFKFLNDNYVYVPKFNKMFEAGRYRHTAEGNMEICGDDDSVYASEARITYRPYFSILTVVGISISILSLCVHLVVFALVKELRNLSGKNLASFCVALLIAYCSFTVGSVLHGKACTINAITTFYFFLAAFSWMLIMSFDVWRTLRIATKELRVNSGKQWRKFFIYSFCSWVMPAKIVLVAVLVDMCPMSVISAEIKPQFGVRMCWFGQGLPILVFFGLPVFLILVCNLVFFLSSAYMIYSSHSMTRYSASPGTKRDFRLYARLALLMGLTWVFGLVAGFVNNEILWVVFILSNTFLGLFIFLAFTCRKKVLHALKNLKRDNVLNIPAFSWSMNGSEGDRKSDGRSEKQSTNTYYT